jgi:hypothetical protein
MTATKTQKSSKRMKIVVEQLFGPYASVGDVTAAKKMLKKKVAKIAFSATQKAREGYFIKGRMTYTKSVDAPASMIKQHLQAQIPGAKISVTRA